MPIQKEQECCRVIVGHRLEKVSNPCIYIPSPLPLTSISMSYVLDSLRLRKKYILSNLCIQDNENGRCQSN